MTPEETIAALQADNAKLDAELKAAKATAATATTDLEAARKASAEFAGKVQMLETSLKTAAAERDQHKGIADQRQTQVEKLTNEGRERDLLDALAGKAPGVDRQVLRGLVVDLGEKGQINRYPEKAADVADDVLGKLKSAAPATFAGRHVNAGGPPSGGSTGAARGPFF